MMFRFVSATALTFCFSSTALADCGPCQPAPQSFGAHAVDVQRGVTVMRGNIPNINNPRAALTQARMAAEKRAEAANLRAIRAERAADQARAELLARRSQPVFYNLGPSRSGYQPRYNSGRYRFGASVSRASFGKRRQGFGGRGTRGRGQAISRPVFTRGIRG